MEKTAAEYRIIKDGNQATLIFRKQDRDLSHFFESFRDEDPLNGLALGSIIENAVKKTGNALPFREQSVEKDICLVTDEADEAAPETFADAFLDELEVFYAAHEVHVTRMFGSFVYLKRLDGELRAVHATPVPLRHCPLMKQLLKEVGGEAAERLLASLEAGDAAAQPELMCRLINEVVIRGGYFDTSRPLNSCEANVLFGASETMSSAFQRGLLDAAVIVSNNLGTIITTSGGTTQGAVKRMTGLFLTSPSKELASTAVDAGIIPVFPHTALIDQLEGVRFAIALGYTKIAVSVAWQDNSLLDAIGALEKEGVTLYKFGLCSTGIGDAAADAMEKHADLIWSCASKVIRTRVEPNAIAQVGVKIPVHIMTENGWKLVKNHIAVTDKARSESSVCLNNVVCRRGKDKPVVLNDADGFKIIAARDLQDCADCPFPCV